MSQQTNIEWCDSTFNPWIGCTRISPACDDCYAARSTPARALGVVWGSNENRRRTSAGNWAFPRRWNAAAVDFFEKHGRRQRVFCASLADVFDNEVPAQWRSDLWELIRETPNLDWLLLTKRIGNVMSMLPACSDFASDFPNVWLGATICNQAEADRDLPKLIATPARIRFLSIEPLLGPIDLIGSGVMRLESNSSLSPSGRQPDSTRLRGIGWVIVGGESGPKARPMSPDWVRLLRDQCEASSVPFLFKQWGEWIPMLGQAQGIAVRPEKVQTKDGWVMGWAGKRAAGRLIDGHGHDGFPE